MDRLMSLLKEKDTALWLKLHQQDLKPQYYGFRWIMLLLSQEFPLPDVIRLWDSLLSDENRFDFLIDVCCAMLLLLRDDLIRGDFLTNMKLVQNFPSTDIHQVVMKAVELSR
ncbi:TBC1 domain family member 13 [Lamellibrachia satsuma]|nr:TBC1 domain family member 13 [Lamellibrachia satsuma]